LIRGILRLSRGDLYRPSRARESEERLTDLGVFRGVTVAPQDPDLPARVKPIVVTVTERPNQAIEPFAGVSTGQGVRGGFDYIVRNLFGWAIGLRLHVQFNYQFFFLDDELADRFGELSLAQKLERRISLGINIPYIPALRWLRTALDLVHVRDNERSFGLDKNSIGLSFTLRPTRRVSVGVGETLENSNVDLLTGEAFDEFLRNTTDPRLQRLLRVPEGRSTLVATRTEVSLDLRDNPFVPTRGGLLSASAEWARTIDTEQVGSDGDAQQFFSNHIRAVLTASGYIPIGEHLVFAAQLRFGRVFHLSDDSETYPNRQFFLGGVDTIRGFQQDALIPQDLADEIEENPDIPAPEVLTGGDTFLLGRFELRFPLTGDLHAGLFADVGNLWTDPTEIDPIDLRPTAGLGLRIGTPVGPLAFDYGFNILRRRELNEPFGAFHFSIGLF
jgi:outer membrane protein assembly factor BamA